MTKSLTLLFIVLAWGQLEAKSRNGLEPSSIKFLYQHFSTDGINKY